jgi:GMP synthase (glutamine-hydrolysing)
MEGEGLMGTVTILQTGSTNLALRAARGDMGQWFRDALRAVGVQSRVWDAASGELPLVDPGAVVIVTGSPASVEDRLPWSVATADWLWEAAQAGAAILGVCYGHQLLADRWGGTVGRARSGLEIGTQVVHRDGEDPLFAGLPRELAVQQNHGDEVTVVPPGAVVLAGNPHSAVQALRLGERVWSVQFHPEVDEEIARAWVEEAGRDPAQVRPTRAAASILGRFVSLVG